jgi:hypothetical protein
MTGLSFGHRVRLKKEKNSDVTSKLSMNVARRHERSEDRAKIDKKVYSKLLLLFCSVTRLSLARRFDLQPYGPIGRRQARTGPHACQLVDLDSVGMFVAVAIT